MIDFSLIGRSDWLRGKCKFFFDQSQSELHTKPKQSGITFDAFLNMTLTRLSADVFAVTFFFCNHTTFSFFKTLSSALERLKVCDDAFRKQLEQERRAHEQQLQTLANEKQQEVERANNRVRKESEKSC